MKLFYMQFAVTDLSLAFILMCSVITLTLTLATLHKSPSPFILTFFAVAFVLVILCLTLFVAAALSFRQPTDFSVRPQASSLTLQQQV